MFIEKRSAEEGEGKEGFFACLKAKSRAFGNPEYLVTGRKCEILVGKTYQRPRQTLLNLSRRYPFLGLIQIRYLIGRQGFREVKHTSGDDIRKDKCMVCLFLEHTQTT